MLKIQPQQARALQDAEAVAFEVRLGTLLRRCFPKRCQSLRAGELTMIVGTAITTARDHGIFAERDTAKLAALLLVLGPDLDVDVADAFGVASVPSLMTSSGPTQMSKLYDSALATMSPETTRNVTDAFRVFYDELPDARAERIVAVCAGATEGWPPILIDAHMHIQSGNCTPWPPLVNIVNDHFPLNLRLPKKIGRSALNSIAKLFKWRLGPVSSKPTDDIGRTFIGKNDRLFLYTPGAESSFLGIAIVLPMDMDYCHIDGYLGVPIYQKDYLGWYYPTRESGQLRDKEGRLQNPEKQYIDVNEKNGKAKTEGHRTRETLSLQLESTDGKHLADDEDKLLRRLQKRANRTTNQPYGPTSAAMEPAKLDQLIKAADMDLYETWKQQRRRTEAVVVEHPMRLLPMYHYDPRRYITNEDRDLPFKQIATLKNAGVYVGIKLYTSQGYMPMETASGDTTQTAEVLCNLYSRCVADDIPIMNHCTPAGFYTHHRRLYIDLADEDTKRDYMLTGKPEAKIEKKLNNKRRLRYFKDHFVHPATWEPVLAKFPKLRICLAHFASDASLWDVDVSQFGKPSLPSGQIEHLEKLLNKKREDWKRAECDADDGRPVATPTAAEFLDTVWSDWDESHSFMKPCMDMDGILYAKSWVGTIVDLCNHENFYTDISYLPIWEKVGDPKKGRSYWEVLGEIFEKYPHMMRKTMFGTDWYLIAGDGYTYRNWLRKTYKTLAKVQTYLEGKAKWSKATEDADEACKKLQPYGLFYQLAIVNPLRFYRLLEIGNNLKKGFEQRDLNENGKRMLKERHATLMRLKGRIDELESAIRTGRLRFENTSLDNKFTSGASTGAGMHLNTEQ